MRLHSLTLRSSRTYAQAALGAEVEVPTLDGKIPFTIKEGTQPGDVLRVKGKGIPYLNGRGIGDLLLKIVVEVPKGLNAEQKKLLEELMQPEYEELFMRLTGSYQDIALSDKEVAEIMEKLPADLSEERKQVVLTAYQLLGKVNYFWGGKSLVLGWDSRWGTPMEVTAAGSSSSGTVRPFGLDCSGFVDWVFYNVTSGSYVIGHGGGASSQHSYCTDISWSDAQPGDLVFYPGDSHVGIVCGFDGNGNVLIIHCASGYNNVVVTGKSGFTSMGRPTYYAD